MTKVLDRERAEEIKKEYQMSLDEARHTDIHKLTIGDIALMINNRLDQAINKILKECSVEMASEEEIKRIIIENCYEYDRKDGKSLTVVNVAKLAQALLGKIPAQKKEKHQPHCKYPLNDCSCKPIPEEKKELSACCGVPVKVEGRTTHYYSCLACKRPCDLAEEKKEQPRIEELVLMSLGSCHTELRQDLWIADINNKLNELIRSHRKLWEAVNKKNVDVKKFDLQR